MTYDIRRKFVATIATTVITLLPVLAQAAAGKYENPFKLADTIPCFLLTLVDFVLLIGVPILVMCIIYAGFLFVTGGDNEAKVGKARTTLTWTLVGGLVLFGAKAIALAIESTVISLGAPGAAALAC